MTKRNWTPEQREAARNLRCIWDAKKKQLGLTQEIAAHRLGYAYQSAAQQYLSGNVPMGTDAIIAWAELLGVSPEKICPGLKGKFEVLGPVLAHTDGDLVELSRDELDLVKLWRRLSLQQQRMVGPMLLSLV